MPGPVSDSYDSEFDTSANRCDVISAIEEVRDFLVAKRLGNELKNIIHVVHGGHGDRFRVILTKKELRVIRYALNCALGTLRG